MKLIVGLGNPGTKYQNNRHNIGFKVAEELARGNDFKEKFKGLYAQAVIDGEKVVILKPLTFMNLSGESVRAACDFFKVEPADVIVVHDELDLDPTKVKIKTGGGEAGHNGLKSITQHLGTPNYKRVRIGIGRPTNQAEVHNYVLSDFSKAETPDFITLTDNLARVFPLILDNEDAKSLSELALLQS